jgi:hypothetical protein
VETHADGPWEKFVEEVDEERLNNEISKYCQKTNYVDRTLRSNFVDLRKIFILKPIYVIIYSH